MRCGSAIKNDLKFTVGPGVDSPLETSWLFDDIIMLASSQNTQSFDVLKFH